MVVRIKRNDARADIGSGITKEESVDNEILTVEDVARILHIAPNTIHSSKWKIRTGCPLHKHGKRLLAIAKEFWEWFKNQRR